VASHREFQVKRKVHSSNGTYQKKNVDSTRVAAIGYCYGDSVVLNMSCARVDLRGIVSFHGNLAPIIPIEKKAVQVKILVCNGGADKFVSEKDIINFKQAVKNERDKV
jgi:dienelactone hydrolase